ncbi:hypothetical protein [Legionella fairfieldensis]|uniref:hypothetical protein n=1 Tax=Legionella fairfieldensis TaxID=45064 RepID=UPI00048DAE5B|nr:hypothetical protein [Legionella fairfieldensis]
MGKQQGKSCSKNDRFPPVTVAEHTLGYINGYEEGYTTALLNSPQDLSMVGLKLGVLAQRLGKKDLNELIFIKNSSESQILHHPDFLDAFKEGLKVTFIKYTPKQKSFIILFSNEINDNGDSPNYPYPPLKTTDNLSLPPIKPESTKPSFLPPIKELLFNYSPETFEATRSTYQFQEIKNPLTSKTPLTIFLNEANKSVLLETRGLKRQTNEIPVKSTNETGNPYRLFSQVNVFAPCHPDLDHSTEAQSKPKKSKIAF